MSESSLLEMLHISGLSAPSTGLKKGVVFSIDCLPLQVDRLQAEHEAERRAEQQKFEEDFENLKLDIAIVFEQFSDGKIGAEALLVRSHPDSLEAGKMGSTDLAEKRSRPQNPKMNHRQLLLWDDLGVACLIFQYNFLAQEQFGDHATQQDADF